MYNLYLASGAAVLTAGTLTGAYLMYALYKMSTSKSAKQASLVTLSEILVSVGIGAFFIYFYSTKNNELPSGVNGAKYSLNGTGNSTIPCNCEELWMEQALLLVSLAHCFITLVTTGVQCQKCLKTNTKTVKINVEPSTSKKQEAEDCKNGNDSNKLYSDILKNDLLLIAIQWVVPILTILLMCFSIDAFKENKIENSVNDIQTLITDVLENPINITTNQKYKQDVDNIVSRVYSIIEEVNNNESEHTGPKPSDIYNIIEMLEIKSREPKMMKETPETNYKFKIYTFFFTIFDFLIPLMYSNVMYIKSKMCLKYNQSKSALKKAQDDLSMNMSYLKVSIILATILWTPSYMEFLSRTFLTNNQPSLVTEGLIATGSSYMLVRNGIHLKAIRKQISQSKSVLPLN